jgi:hypothetical protein
MILEGELQSMAQEAMGDTPVSLTSPDDRSKLLYSRKVKDKSVWGRLFNLGMERRGATMKPKQRPRMSGKEFRTNVSMNTEVIYKTEAERCAGCSGSGRIRLTRKDGTPSKALRICKACGGEGVIYKPTSEVAGFKIIPRNVRDVASAGFRTDKETL